MSSARMQGNAKPATWSLAAHRGAIYTLLSIVAVGLWWLPAPAAQQIRYQLQWVFEPGTRLIHRGVVRAYQLAQYIEGETADGTRLHAQRRGP